MREQRSTRSNLAGAAAAGGITVLFCLILLWHDPLLFWNDDYELSILPVFADVARSWNEGHWPLLSPYSWVCSNLAGEFQYGTFSLFVNAAVVLIWKFRLTFAQQAAALSITHLFVLAAGAFLLARHRLRRGGAPPESPGAGTSSSVALATFVALIAALNGWIMCWGAIDWFGALGAFAWLPWAWWAMEKSLAMASSSSRRPEAAATFVSWRDVTIAAMWPAPFVYLVITGGFPYVVVMLALLIAWLSVRSLVETRSLIPILPMMVGIGLGVGWSAPAWLALFDCVAGSAREAQPAAAHWQWIVPWRALPGLILPCWTVNWADFSTRMTPHRGAELASGIIAPLAVLGALIDRGRAFVRQMKWELLLLLVVLLLAMVPTAGVFRWSFRWLPLFHLVLALCAAEALRGIGLQPMIRGQTPMPRYGLTGLFLTGITAIAMSLLHTTGEYAFPLTWVLLALVAIWFAIESWLPRTAIYRWTPAALTFAALLATYLCIPPNCGVPKYNLSQELTTPAPLDPQRLYLSIYPWAELTYRVEARPQPVGQVVRPGSTSMWGGLRFVNGYSPIRPAGVARDFRFTIHGEVDPDMGEYLLRDQSGVLAELGIDGLTIAQEVQVDPPSSEWQLVFSNSEGRVYHHNGPPFPMVRSVGWIDTMPEAEFAIAQVSAIKDLRNSIAANIDVPPGEKSALLKISRPYFRGYVGYLDDKPLKVDSYRGLFPVVEIPAGWHGRLLLRYRPGWLIYGGALAILCLAIFLCGLVAAAVTGNSRNLRSSLS